MVTVMVVMWYHYQPLVVVVGVVGVVVGGVGVVVTGIVASLSTPSFRQSIQRMSRS